VVWSFGIPYWMVRDSPQVVRGSPQDSSKLTINGSRLTTNSSRLTIEGSRLKVKDQNSKCASTKLGTGAYKYIASHKYWRYPFHHKSGTKNVLASCLSLVFITNGKIYSGWSITRIPPKAGEDQPSADKSRRGRGRFRVGYLEPWGLWLKA
jgi:hypothetical protein